MSEPLIAALPSRGAVAVTGPDAVKFLNGLVTNEVAPLREGEAAHAGLLSPQGKILFDFLCVRTPQGLLLDVARESAPGLVKRLALYKLRADVSLSDVSDSYTILALWGDGAASPGETRGTHAFADPRHADLGRRILADRVFAADIALATNARNAPEQAYHAHRIALGVPEGGLDYDFADTYPHEADFDLFNGVSFTKGCYVGQEIVARMQHKTIQRKRVVRVIGDADLPADRPSVMAGGVAIGKLGSVMGAHGLAMLRLDRAVEFANQGVTLSAGGVALAPDARDMEHYARAAAREKP